MSLENSECLGLWENRLNTQSKKVQQLFPHAKKLEIRNSVTFIKVSYQGHLKHEASFARSKVNEP